MKYKKCKKKCWFSRLISRTDSEFYRSTFHIEILSSTTPVWRCERSVCVATMSQSLLALSSSGVSPLLFSSDNVRNVFLISPLPPLRGKSDKYVFSFPLVMLLVPQVFSDYDTLVPGCCFFLPCDLLFPSTDAASDVTTETLSVL